MRGDVQKIMSSEPLNLYSPVVNWSTVRFLLIIQWVIGLNSHIIYFTNAFSQADIPSGGPVCIELHRYFKIDGVQFDVVIGLNKSLLYQSKAAFLWH